jgi:hypothetical protein
MTAYRVQLYREQRIVFTGIEAGSAEEAARLASAKPTAEAQSVGALRGPDWSALVDREDKSGPSEVVRLRADGGPIDPWSAPVTGSTRASWADAALDVYVQRSHCDPDEALSEHLSALMHLAARQQTSLPFHMERAFGRFEEQLAEEGRAPPHPLAQVVPPRRFREAAWRMLSALEALLPHVTQQLEEQRQYGFPAYSDFEKAVGKAVAAVDTGAVEPDARA